ncbi:MAG: phage/plasmid primase, P4 family [Campylobacterota bacterium]|nr:phage/plasmid primase, P4 family [Campylobacterota bacterium]
MSKDQLGKILEDKEKVLNSKQQSAQSSGSAAAVGTLKNITSLSAKLKNPKNTFGKDPSLITIEDKSIELLDDILSNVKPLTGIDYIDAICKLDFPHERKPVDSIQKLTNKDFKNIVVNELMLLLEKYSLHLTYTENNLYIFNTEFWVRVEDQQMLYFLRDVAVNMGGPRYMVGDVKFAEDMYKQLKHSGLFIRNNKQSDELLLNLQNGTLHITHDVIDLGTFNNEDFLKYQLPFEYNPKSINQEWLDFLQDVLPNAESRRTLQQALGSLLIRGLKIEKIILLYGSGANGKSVIFEVLRGLLGEDSFSNYSLNSLTSSAYYVSQLKDKIINYSPDIDLSKINAGKMKILASGEPIECKVPNKEPYIMKNYAKMIFNLNNIKNAKVEDTNGFFRRLLLIPFNVTIPPAKQDKKLPEKLLKNKAGILNWLLEGTREVVANEAIYESPECKAFIHDLQGKPSSVEIFVEYMGIKHDTKNRYPSRKLHELYKSMCEDQELICLTEKGLTNEMERLGYTKKRETPGVSWHIVLNSNHTHPTYPT